MSCPRGKAAPDHVTRLRLFADSGGFCQNPKCLASLFLAIGNESIHIGEMAHVFSASDMGPRADPTLSEAERGNYKNLILLCPNCHTVVDKAEKEFPDSMLAGWKKKHRQRIDEAFGVVEYATRQETRAAIEPLLGENRVIFDTYGPETEERYNPESEMPILWNRKIITKLLPNNRRILHVLDRNRHQLRDDELRTLELFHQHVDDFEAKHIEGVSSSGTRFPIELTDILR
jgi:hypothetical protein